MKYLLLTAGVFFYISSAFSQTSFSNIEEPTEDTSIHFERTDGVDLKVFRNKVRSFPNRLDYRYEYINELSVANEWGKFTNEVISLVNNSYSTEHNWIWAAGESPIGEDPEGFVLNTVQDFIFMLYITDDPVQHDNIRAICDMVLEYNETHVDFLTYPAMTYDAIGNYEAALEYLEKAENLHPADAKVAILLAENATKLGKLNTAMVYYQKALRHGDERDVKEARVQLAKLDFK